MVNRFRWLHINENIVMNIDFHFCQAVPLNSTHFARLLHLYCVQVLLLRFNIKHLKEIVLKNSCVYVWHLNWLSTRVRQALTSGMLIENVLLTRPCKFFWFCFLFFCCVCVCVCLFFFLKKQQIEYNSSSLSLCLTVCNKTSFWCPELFLSLWTNVLTPVTAPTSLSAAICALPLSRNQNYSASCVGGHNISACRSGKKMSNMFWHLRGSELEAALLTSRGFQQGINAIAFNFHLSPD